MENLSDQEQRSKNAYRLVFIGGIIAAIGIVVWFSRPLHKVDMRFLNPLHPRVTRDQDEITLNFDQPASEIKALVAAHLFKPEWDSYAPPTAQDADYTYHGRRDLSLTISPNYPPAPAPPPPPATPKPGGTVYKPVAKGSTITIRDPARIVILK